jgi:hypothetical protein
MQALLSETQTRPSYCSAHSERQQFRRYTAYGLERIFAEEAWPKPTSTPLLIEGFQRVFKSAFIVHLGLDFTCF